MMLNNQQQQEELPPSRRITLSKAVEDVKHLLEINKAMKIALNELKSENEKMVERYRMLTKALGACECLGENVICPICHGKGAPGTFLIDERAFNKYVYPLIQRITQTVEQSNAVEEKKNSFEEKKEGSHSQNGKLHPKKNGLSN